MKKRPNLAIEEPELALQWHPTKNGTLTPEMVSCASNRKVWWYMPYDDPESGKHFIFEWEERIFNRVRGHGCPVLTGRIAWPGYNDLATKRPDLAGQWHPTKNGSLVPEMVTCGSGKKVWWMLIYEDPVTGESFTIEWQEKVCYRTDERRRDFTKKKDVRLKANCLAVKRPDLAGEWHPTKNGGLTPEMVSCGSNIKVWWYRPYDDPESGKHFDFEWPQVISSRTRGYGCPILVGLMVWPGFNDLASKEPDLAEQWHPTKNGTLTPDKVVSGSRKEVWWQLPYDDPNTGKHFDFEWKEQICVRMRWPGCPIVSGRMTWPGFNDLATKNPAIAAQWHPTKNGDLTPEMVTSGSNKKVYWHMPYDDPATGKHFDFEWEEQICERSKGYGCPVLSNHIVWPGFNDLASKYPELAAQWNYEKNLDLTPEMVTCGSQKKVWWLLAYDDPETGKHFDFEWEASIANRSAGTKCPFLSGDAVYAGFNDLASKRPDVAVEWHPTKNGKLTPEKVTCGSGKLAWWCLPYDDPETGNHFDFEWKATIVSRTSGSRCPYLSGDAVWVGYNDLATCYPKIANEWHPMKNRKVTPTKIYKETSKKVWWQCSECGYEWYASVKGRTVDGAGCPKCRKNRTYYL